ncbi:uncharacterized protein LOC122316234 [Carya illinoinensis]|uniref:uncharacterized protein LOC122316234 n=1 Tax=Carya illinoinensis TaxID=32201 RepID=UPI001C7250D0|nr:uncharacterized protein LOC122316234 [Carya illinoinensis]
MNCLSWNARGLGNPRGIRVLRDLIKKEALDIVFLQETHLTVRDFDRCKFSLSFVNCLAIDRKGNSGGLALLWGKDFNLSILSYSKNHIDACVEENVSKSLKYFITGFYGNPDASQRWRSWDLLRSLCHRDDEAWLVFGDFNEILFSHEKLAGRDRSQSQMNDFRQTMDACSLWDIGFRGPKYTWCNGRDPESRVCERLDRFFGNSRWWVLFPQVEVVHGGAAYSDHIPISLASEIRKTKRRTNRVFRFEAMWIGESSCDKIVQDTWVLFAGRNKMEDVMQKIGVCG